MQRKICQRLSICVLVLIANACTINIGEKSARRKCYLNHIGTYVVDTNTIDSSKFHDWKVCRDFRITFKTDSTFFMNKRVPFFVDTYGMWDAGTCGFESSGTIKYFHSPVESQFGPYNSEAAFFSMLYFSNYDRQLNLLQFKKIK